MLDKDSLSQLKQLKQQIEESKEHAEGTVKATQRKFGFLVTDDGREVYLSPDEMQKVFPGDRARILVVRSVQQGAGKSGEAAKEKVSGRIEKVLKSAVTEFAGRYVVKGKGHFVEPDLHHNQRWIFVPPAARNGASDGDYVLCKLSRHPYPHGKPQAKVLQVIGNDAQAGIEADFVIARFQLQPDWPADWNTQLAPATEDGREDLSGVAFVTIDAPSTQDMDDALYAEATDSGWRLQVAIADAAAILVENSALDKQARRRATSVYLPGRPVPMLPTELANERCSLLPGERRPALVCQLDISTDGTIQQFRFVEATVISQAKLSYEQVAGYIDKAEADAALQPHSDNLSALKDVAAALLANRRQHHLVIPARPEFRMILNPQQKLERVEAVDKSSAHQLVEECMVAVNRSAAEFIGERGLFIEHPGFRPERIPDVKKLAGEHLSLSDVDFASPAGYLQLMKSIDDEALDFPLRAVLSRLLERSRLVSGPRPHQGMGLNCYTTVTSPIRKYGDLVCQRIIKAKIHQRPQPACDKALLELLQQRQDNARQARSQMEQWLKCDYMAALVGQTLEGVVTQVNSNGFSVRLDQHLIEGFVETRQLQEKFSFDPMRLRLKSNDCTIGLNQRVRVVVSSVDRKLRSIRFTLATSTSAATTESAAAEA